MLQVSSSGGMRKLPGKHNSPVAVSVPGGVMRVESARHGKRRASRVFYVGCLTAVALMLVCACVRYLAVLQGFEDSQRLTFADEPTSRDNFIAKWMKEMAARREQKWTSSPPATAHGMVGTGKPTASSTTTTPTAAPSSPLPIVTRPVTTSDKGTPTTSYPERDKPNPEAPLSPTDFPEATPFTATTTVDLRTVRPDMYKLGHTQHTDYAECDPEEPHLLPGLQIQRRTFTPAELLERFGDTDIIYSFVNGSEANHQYRKQIHRVCMQAILDAESNAFHASVLAPVSAYHNDAPRCLPDSLWRHIGPEKTVADFVGAVEAAARHGVDNRDRETDELRHSLRSVEQHVRWHRGRVVMVSPGHHPTWVDGAKNFLAGMCGGARVQALRSSGTHLRVTTVHQDAVMPYGMRLTVDSHVIEQHLWRVRNMTPVHVYMNDDYFVNRDAAITDLFNEYGGTIVRTERGIIAAGAVADRSASWAKGVLHTQQFNIMELDVLREDYLPEALVAMWDSLKRVNRSAGAAAVTAISVPPLDEAVDVAHQYEPDPLPGKSLIPRRPRRYTTHAPFVYCTNMFRFFETRYEREFAATALRHRSRKARDLFIPFVYNAFIMARPWQASPKFLPYLLELHRSRRQGRADAMPPTEIVLDNVDGCGPASLLSGATESDCVFAKFLNDLTLNEAVVERVRQVNPLYFNINAGFSSAEAADQLRRFLHGKFPTPVYLEVGGAPPPGEGLVDGAGEVVGGRTRAAGAAAAAEEEALSRLFGDLMALPVVGVVSYEEGVCPLVRSLALAFAGHHRGGVRVSVEQHGGAALREARAALGHRVVSAMPAPACAYKEQVSVDPAARGESVAEIARRAMGEMRGGVELPSTCGAGGAGLRVRGFVVDARTRGAPVRSAAALRDALAVPAQTLSLEDFRAVAVGPSEGDVVLVVSREDAEAKAVHWVNGASESDLLVTYPLPVEAYEDMGAEVRWSVP
ncbi:Protein_of_uncharacterised_function_(DUF3184)_-_putative [Leishmania infantum]|uniref:Protein_of_uncharacterized_function_(DUF3184)_-_p utative n=2 Tax=Leishmania infantum TaxID=5671 RepID=A0A6L0X7D9_LEIIN|nr:Protein_of_uncharacterised_function_(DUF3184)_-_putative [Leishmania infantum]SUZ40685.1 Protein_of_uncharacterised_function_(DUF3184)_-_putative [Leishmania infantum]